MTYFLNGEAADFMLANLQRRCEQAIGNGMLTGDTAAEVHRHEISTTLLPEPLSEDEIFDYMYRRIAVYGRWRREGEVCNVVAARLVDLTPLLGRLADATN
ncbi:MULTISPECIES: hypothetical protein [Pseudomonadota]|uniref:Uncharacterized protein n=1 Tax=Pseudomonas veronii TaxID=76761 RepID=A0A7Y1F8N4_PSEVE|nr:MULTISPECIES: hypothetical protein [Pseudomonadota]MDF8361333.1 hypothetical protein [Achromobacter anxifer]NMY08884.1 hypothetical protein [Pseudomonas veronii]